MSGNDLNVFHKIDELKDSLTQVQMDMGEEITTLKVSVGKLCVKMDTVKGELELMRSVSPSLKDWFMIFAVIIAAVTGSIIGVMF